MLKFDKSSVVDLERYLEEVRRRSYICYHRQDMADRRDEEAVERDTWHNYVSKYMAIKSARKHRSVDRNFLIQYLKMVEGCPPHYFETKGANGTYDSASKSGVLEKLYGNGYAKEFFEIYFKYAEHKDNVNRVSSLIDRCNYYIGTDKFGKDIYSLPFTANPQQNLRVNYSGEDVVAMVKSYLKFHTTEPGYFLAWGDFKQSDLRVVMSTLMSIAKYIHKAITSDDLYRVIAEMVDEFLDVAFDEEKFLEKRNDYKAWCLSCLYGTRGAIVRDQDAFCKEFSKFLFTQPKYIEYINRLVDRHKLQKSIAIETYFGGFEAIAWKDSEESFVNKCLSTVGQRGTSEIVILTALTTIDRFRELGYSEDDFSIYVSRHDEIVFRVKECCIKDMWILKDHSIIQIPGYIPIKLDFSYGYNYGVVDEELTEKIEAVYSINKDKIDIDSYQYDSNSGLEDWYPVKPVAVFVLHTTIIPDNSTRVVTLLNERNNRAYSSVIDGTSLDTLNDYMHNLFEDISDVLIDNGYQDILVMSNYPLGDNKYNDMIGFDHFVKYRVLSDGSLNNVTALNHFVTNVHCKKSEVACPVSPPRLEYEPIIKGIKMVDKKELV